MDGSNFLLRCSITSKSNRFDRFRHLLCDCESSEKSDNEDRSLKTPSSFERASFSAPDCSSNFHQFSIEHLFVDTDECSIPWPCFFAIKRTRLLEYVPEDPPPSWKSSASIVQIVRVTKLKASCCSWQHHCDALAPMHGWRKSQDSSQSLNRIFVLVIVVDYSKESIVCCIIPNCSADSSQRSSCHRGVKCHLSEWWLVYVSMFSFVVNIPRTRVE